MSLGPTDSAMSIRRRWVSAEEELAVEDPDNPDLLAVLTIDADVDGFTYHLTARRPADDPDYAGVDLRVDAVTSRAILTVRQGPVGQARLAVEHEGLQRVGMTESTDGFHFPLAIAGGLVESAYRLDAPGIDCIVYQTSGGAPAVASLSANFSIVGGVFDFSSTAPLLPLRVEVPPAEPPDSELSEPSALTLYALEGTDPPELWAKARLSDGVTVVTWKVSCCDVTVEHGLTPPVGTLALTGVVPTVELGGFALSVPSGSLTLTGVVPTIEVDGGVILVSAPAGSLTLTGFVPTVDVGGILVSAPAGSLTLTGFVPGVTVT